jgi:hypothetical protein
MTRGPGALLLAGAVAGWACAGHADEGRSPAGPQAEPKPNPIHRVKVSRSGEVYLNGRAVSLTDMAAELLQLKARGEGIVYYRESPRRDPTPEAMAVFEVIAATKVPIQLGEDALPQWGILKALEVELAPHRFRFAIMRDRPFLFGYVPEGAEERETFYGPLKDQERWLRAADLLLTSDRVLETPVHLPNQAFTDKTVQVPSLHIRVVYDYNRGWQSWYRPEQIPPNLQSLLEDCEALGLEMLPPPEQRKRMPRVNTRRNE